MFPFLHYFTGIEKFVYKPKLCAGTSQMCSRNDFWHSFFTEVIPFSRYREYILHINRSVSKVTYDNKLFTINSFQTDIASVIPIIIRNPPFLKGILAKDIRICLTQC